MWAVYSFSAVAIHVKNCRNVHPLIETHHKFQGCTCKCRKAPDGGQELTLHLRGPEASDYLNFVIKDESTGTWYDQYGSNFKVALRLALTSQAFDEDDDSPAQIPDSELPELPTELCGIWSYIKWETAGCPQRNQHEADEEYQKAIQVGCHADLILKLQ